LDGRSFEGLTGVRTAQRLASVIVHTRDQTLFTITDHDIGGHRNDPCPDPFSCSPADFLDGFVPVHVGHLTIHQNDIVPFPLQRINHLEAVGDDIGVESKLVQIA